MAESAPVAATVIELDAWVIERNRVALGVYHAPLTKATPPLPFTSSKEHLRAGQTLDVERVRKEIFVSTLAHELRQPLSALLAGVEVIRLTSHSPEAARATEIMKRQIGQMNRVVEDLLDATRWAHGTLTLRKQQLDVRDVIRDAASDVAAAVAERGHTLVVTTPSQPLWIDADPQRLQQVLSNLLRNSIKYTDPGGQISLTAQPCGTEVMLRVCDNGRGITSEALPYLFEMYSQVRSLEAVGLGSVSASCAKSWRCTRDGSMPTAPASAKAASSSSRCPSPPDNRDSSVVQNDAQQRVVDLEAAVVLDESELAEFVHEEVDARPRRPHHFRKRLLRQLRQLAMGGVIFAVTRQQQERSRQPFLTRVEQLIDEVFFDADVAHEHMREESIGEVLLLVQCLLHFALLNAHHGRRHNRCRCPHAQRLPRKASFAKEVARSQHADHGLFA